MNPPPLRRRPSGPIWVDAEAGPVVRPYTLTQGRAGSEDRDFDMVAFVQARAGEGFKPASQLQPEQRAILALVHRPLSVAEVAAHVDLPLGVVRVLLGDLRRQGLVAVQEPVEDDQRDENVLHAVMDRLRTL
jgi:Protein of unknown function (DUF742)